MKAPLRLCFVGALTGRIAGRPVTQGEMVAEGLAAAGYHVVAASAAPNRYLRFLDILSTLLAWRRANQVLIVQVYGGPSFVVEDLASGLGRWMRQRIIMHIHGGAIPEFMRRFPRWTRRVLARADAIVTPSPYLQRALAVYGFRARTIPNLVGTERYPYRAREAVRPRLFWMRAFHHAYNPEMAVHVLDELRREFPDAQLTLAGADFGTRREVEALVARLGVSGAVRFPGWLDTEGKIREGTAHDIFLNTSRIDNMPVSVSEALAMGLPVVATAVGGLPDMLQHEETGLLVPDDDDEAMAAAVKRLLVEPGLAEQLSLAGRRLVESWTWSRIRPMWEALLHEVRSRA